MINEKESLEELRPPRAVRRPFIILLSVCEIAHNLLSLCYVHTRTHAHKSNKKTEKLQEISKEFECRKGGREFRSQEAGGLGVLPTAHGHVGRLIDQLELRRIAGHLAAVLAGRVHIQLLQLHVADELIAMRRAVGDGDTFDGKPICCRRC